MATESPDQSNAQRLAELAALVDAVKERVRTQYPESTSNGSNSGAICVGLPDLGPLSRARDAAAGKMAAIGTVNPRRGGVVNSSIQSIKRTVARALNWFVRDQIIFNRQLITCVETAIETLADVNRTIHALAVQANLQIQQVRGEAEPLRAEALALRAKTSELQDIASHWPRWREQWQLKLHKNEVEFLKSVADLNTAVHQKVMYIEAAAQQRITGIEQSTHELHAAYERRIDELQSAYQDFIRLAQENARKTAQELDASYRRTATELEAACQQTAGRIDAQSSSAVASLQTRLENGFRQTVTQLTHSYRETLTQAEAAFQHRATEAERAAAESLRAQHEAFEQLANSNATAIEKSTTSQISQLDQRIATSISDLQTRFYADLDRIRTEYERIIHAELRVVRQRLAVPQSPAVPAAPPAALPFDYTRFADRFRGPEQYVTDSQRFYVPFFAGRRHVLDLGCGRGEFLRLLQDAGVPAKGIEASAESVASCLSQGLAAEQADIFAYLTAQPEASLDGIFCSQVVEHLPPLRLPELIHLCASRLSTGGILVIETPNPECLAIFATHFYLDPTHTRPVPAQLLSFYMQESGLGRITIHYRAPAKETIPELTALPEAIREKLFGGLDYAVMANKL